jgi:heavy metal sensor kinase
MRSIRLSLVVYFLLLLGGVLAAVSGLVYRTSAEALQGKEVSTRKLLTTQYEDRCKEIRERFDQQLKDRARTLAASAKVLTKNNYESLNSLGVLGAALSPSGHLFTPLWAHEGMSEKFDRFVAQRYRPFIRIDRAEEILALVADKQQRDFFQTYRANGQPVQSSESLKDTPGLTLDEKMLKADYLEEILDEVDLRPGLHLRRVTLKVVVPKQQLTFRPWPPMRGPKPPPPRTGREPVEPVVPPKETSIDRSFPVLFVQYAIDTSKLDADLEKARAEYQEGLAELKAGSEADLTALASHLQWIALIAFAAGVVGGWWLIRLGLASLQRLSDAVSQVSERDFSLKVDSQRLPRELSPIAERLTRTLDQLKRAFAREKQAAADISHDLRTPLAALTTNIDLALRKPRSPEEYRELFEDCRLSAQQMSQLVERLLALARLDAGVDRLRTREVDAASLAEQCAAMVRPLAEVRGISLSVRHPGPTCLNTDPDKLREVLTNLLHNAIEYNKPNGTIELAVARDNGDLRLDVMDTGIGIAPAAREHIFERFYRADPSRQADGLHAGLGLAIVKGYIELMGGSIGVDSTEGEGTTFHVSLPVRPMTGPN